MGRLYIYLHKWLISLGSVGKYTIHGSYGNGRICTHWTQQPTTISLPCMSKVTTPVNGLVKWVPEVLTLLQTGRVVWKHVATTYYLDLPAKPNIPVANQSL